MHRLPTSQQIEILGQRAATRRIDPKDRYLAVYFDLLQGVQALLPLTRQNLILVAHAVFGWMPTQLRVNVGQLDKALAVLADRLAFGKMVEIEDLVLLASTFQTTKGNSVVSASKILHFLAPDQYPIWDRLVAKTWGLPPSGPAAAANYRSYIEACRQIALDPMGHEACATLRRRLGAKGHTYAMTDMRLLELMFFLPQESGT